jgi:hypothetical protein
MLNGQNYKVRNEYGKKWLRWENWKKGPSSSEFKKEIAQNSSEGI